MVLRLTSRQCTCWCYLFISLVMDLSLAASLDGSVVASKYQIMSLAQVCGDNIRSNETSIETMKVQLTSFGQTSAIMLLIADPSRKPGEISPDCHVSFEAPERHFLGISYLVVRKGTQSANTFCPFNLTVRNEAVGESNNLCKPEITSPMLPNLYPRRLILDIKPLNSDWPSSFHSLIITSVGADSSVCYKDTNQFPCDWERKQNGQWGDLQPKLCISMHLACDDVINCPLSGADEISALCDSNRNSPQLGEEYEENVDISKRIQAVAEQAAANLVLHHHKSYFNVSSVVDKKTKQHEEAGQKTEKSKSFNVVITVIYCLFGFLISIFVLLHLYFRNKMVPNNNNNARDEAGESIELGVTSSPPAGDTDEPDEVHFTAESSSPPAYATLFPPNIKDT